MARSGYQERAIGQTAVSVGLVGDGDEIAAIQDVEAEFGVRLDYDDARNWRTAGDVYRSLLKTAGDGVTDSADVWLRFATALCLETGIDPVTISRDSPLLQPPGFWAAMPNASVLLWTLIGLGLLLGIILSTT